MDGKDIGTVQEILTSLDKTQQPTNNAKIINPAREVEDSLVDFLKHRLTKLKEDVTFEDEIKSAIVARLSEASFPHLVSLMEVLQKNSNIGVEKVLAPFIASSGDKTLLDTTKEMDRNSQISEQIFEETDDKKILQSLVVLNQLMDIANKTREE